MPFEEALWGGTNDASESGIRAWHHMSKSAFHGTCTFKTIKKGIGKKPLTMTQEMLATRYAEI